MKIKGTIGSLPFEAYFSRAGYAYVALKFEYEDAHICFGRILVGELRKRLNALGATITSEED